MKLVLFWAVTIVYLIQAAILFWTNDRPQALIIAGYALANLGLIWSMS